MKKYIFLFLAGLLCLAAPMAAQTQPPDTNLSKERAGARKLTEEEIAKIKAQEQANLAMVKVATPTDPVPGGIDYGNPDTFFAEGLIGTIKAGLLALIAALGGAIPALRRFSQSSKNAKLITSAVFALLALSAIVGFREGAFTENFFYMVQRQFLPNFAYAGLLYSAYQFIVGLIKK